MRQLTRTACRGMGGGGVVGGVWEGGVETNDSNNHTIVVIEAAAFIGKVFP